MTREQIIAELKSAKQGSRALDYEIWKLTSPTEFGGSKITDIRWTTGHVNVTTADGFLHVDAFYVSHFTTDPTAALSRVHERFGWFVAKGMLRPDEPLYGVAICHINDPDKVYGEAEHDDLAIAICIAALSLADQIREAA